MTSSAAAVPLVSPGRAVNNTEHTACPVWPSQHGPRRPNALRWAAKAFGCRWFCSHSLRLSPASSHGLAVHFRAYPVVWDGCKEAAHAMLGPYVPQRRRTRPTSYCAGNSSAPLPCPTGPPHRFRPHCFRAESMFCLPATRPGHFRACVRGEPARRPSRDAGRIASPHSRSARKRAPAGRKAISM